MHGEWTGVRAHHGVSFYECVDKQGRPTAKGLEVLRALLDDICGHPFIMNLRNHEDNTGAACRVDLDGHDCCVVCNAIERALAAVTE